MEEGYIAAVFTLIGSIVAISISTLTLDDMLPLSCHTKGWYQRISPDYYEDLPYMLVLSGHNSYFNLNI